VYSQSCGGSILDENVIIDAAHCVRKWVYSKCLTLLQFS
jgi:hypothetical protein